MERQLHVVFGAGQVGMPLAARLLNAEKRVRVVKRSPGGAISGAELLLGDAARGGAWDAPYMKDVATRRRVRHALRLLFDGPQW